MICIDSDCIIDFLKGKKEAVDIIEKNKDEILTTEINLFEIYFGIFNKSDINEKEKKLADEFFDSLNKLPFSNNCGKKSAEILTSLIKRGKTIQQNDALISAILIENKVGSIITRNLKHFSSMKELKAISY